MTVVESTIWTWGRAKNYRLGRSFVGTDARKPEKVNGFEGVAVTQGACGGGHTAVVLKDQRLFVFGYSQYGQLGLGDRNDTSEATQVMVREPSTKKVLKVRQVACGRYHTIGLSENGQVFTWGGGKNGRLGHGDEKIRSQPTWVETLSNEKGLVITAGYHNNLVLSEKGEVYSWGWGAHGQLGLGDNKDRDIPCVIKELSDKKIVSLSCGDRHSFAISEDGVVYGWGSNEFGQLGCMRKGDSILKPILIEGLIGLKVLQISSGDRHSVAVTNTGAVYTWGCGSDGQCGHGNFESVERPKLVDGLKGMYVTHVRCGHNFSMVVTKFHGIYTWGNNTYGQLGNGNNSSNKLNLPVKVVVDSVAPVEHVSCGHFHCILWTKADFDGKDDVDVLGSGDKVQTSRDKIKDLMKNYVKQRDNCRDVVDQQRLAHVNIADVDQSIPSQAFASNTVQVSM